MSAREVKYREDKKEKARRGSTGIMKIEDDENLNKNIEKKRTTIPGFKLKKLNRPTLVKRHTTVLNHYKELKTGGSNSSKRLSNEPSKVVEIISELNA